MKKLMSLLLLVLLLVAGCYPGEPTTISGQMSSINYFNASPASISAGDSSELSWNVTGATTISIDQGIGIVALTGTRAVAPTVTTTYTLTASSIAGNITASTQVIISKAATEPIDNNSPVINYFTANPSSINLGDYVTLSWNVSNARLITIDNGIGAVSSAGSIVFLPSGTTTYSMEASNSVGSAFERALVKVIGGGVPSPASGLPVINYFDASPPIISSGGSTLLRWNVSNATSITIDNDIGSVGTDGTMLVSPAASTSYTLTATNAYGWHIQPLVVLVTGAQ